MATIDLQTLWSNAFNTETNEFKLSVYPEDIQDKIKSLSKEEARNNGFLNAKGIVSIIDAVKAKAFIDKIAKSLIEDDDDDYDDDDDDAPVKTDAPVRKVKAWLISDTSVKEAPRGEDVAMLVRDIVLRKSRADRNKVVGVGLRGVDKHGKGLKLTLNIQYFNTVMDNAKGELGSSEIIKNAKEMFLDKWWMLGTLVAKAGKTAYFATSLTDEMKKELARHDKKDMVRNSAGQFGFLHEVDGVRYNLAGPCGEQESKVMQAAYSAINEAQAIEVRTYAEKKAEQNALAFGFEAKLLQLNSMLDRQLIDVAKYEILYNKLMENGL